MATFTLIALKCIYCRDLLLTVKSNLASISESKVPFNPLAQVENPGIQIHWPWSTVDTHDYV